jgi:hypothetical protein
LALVLGMPVAAPAPSSPSLLSQHPVPNFGDQSSPYDPKDALEAKRIKLLNVERQKSMVSDAERLLQLARELDADAKADSPAHTPAERIRKTAEIEKLARNVKEKMSYAVGAPSQAFPPVTVWDR